jgi:hypothetical protein
LPCIMPPAKHSGDSQAIGMSLPALAFPHALFPRIMTVGERHAIPTMVPLLR